MMDVKFIEYDWSNSDPVYLSPNYLGSFDGAYGWIAGYINGKLRVVIPYTVKTKFLFKIATFHNAPVYINERVTEIEEKLFLNYCVQLLKHVGVDFCTQPPAHAVFRTYPDGAIAVPFGTYVIDLEFLEEDLWSKVHSKHRNVILNAKKKGVNICISGKQDISLIYDMLVETMARSKMPFISRDKFKKLIESMGDQVIFAIAYYEEQAIGCGVFPFSKYSAYYQYGGSVSVSPVLGAMNLLHWEVIKYFKAEKVAFYNFVGARINPPPQSKLEGIQRFKSRFGATLYSGYLWKIPLTYKYYIYKLIMKIKNFGIMDIIDQEKLRKVR